MYMKYSTITQNLKKARNTEHSSFQKGSSKNMVHVCTQEYIQWVSKCKKNYIYTYILLLTMRSTCQTKE